MDINVMIIRVMEMKYALLLWPIVRMFIEFVRSDAAKKGWARSPVKKSVNANPLKKTWKEVLVKVLFQMVAKIKAFPTTADGDKTAMMTDVEKSTALRKETWCSLPQSSELKLADSWYREVQFVVLDMLYFGSMVHEKHHRQTFLLNVLD